MGNGFPGKCLEGWLDGAVHFRKRLVMFPCKGHFLVRQNRNRRTDRMNAFDYVVVSIEGDYANLKRTDIESDECCRMPLWKGQNFIMNIWNIVLWNSIFHTALQACYTLPAAF